MPIIATLVRTGMLTEASSSENDNLSWVVTRFGLNCLNYLMADRDNSGAAC